MESRKVRGDPCGVMGVRISWVVRDCILHVSWMVPRRITAPVKDSYYSNEISISIINHDENFVKQFMYDKPQSDVVRFL